MDMATEITIEVLNDLILINSDRTTIYEKLMKQIISDDPELGQIFKTIAADSRKYLYELAGHLDPSGQEFLKAIPSSSGKIYQVWASEKRVLTGKDRHAALLDSCEVCEKAIDNAYNEAMKQEITEGVRQVIAEQKNSLKKVYDRIKNLHQMQHI